ncbi:helix-turn-helix domain-containing protein [Smaragdicoccus niigatensis]|uniref:helix-turn-helix domain-containing protein n=1 Tax=Smaragdicoccus niigatensis TaxID=359359 RepID=UPI00037FA0B9|nr:helix-turn-helix transcriptional regulator [Smaragdicoccus niigatensis]
MDQQPDRPDDVAAGEATPVLSRREREVLREWLLSDSKQDVAQKLFLSIGTVNTHLLRIRAKYELAGRAASSKSSLLVRALQDSIIELDEL